MELSPRDRKEVLSLVAAAIVAELRAEAGGDFAELITLPLGAVSQIVGISQARIKDRLPITECTDGKHGVTIAHMRAYKRRRTKYPAGTTEADWTDKPQPLQAAS